MAQKSKTKLSAWQKKGKNLSSGEEKNLPQICQSESRAQKITKDAMYPCRELISIYDLAQQDAPTRIGVKTGDPMRV